MKLRRRLLFCGMTSDFRNIARRLRRRAPATEQVIWSLLRDRRLAGLKFRRQAPIGQYVVDFVCLRHRLIIEADGPFHDPVADQARDEWLASQGFRVLRMPNEQIRDRLVTAILEMTGK